MNILKSLQKNWLYMLVCLMALVIFCSRTFTSHPMNWWNILWVIAPVILIMFSANNNWVILRPFRWWSWENQKDYFELLIKSSDNPMAYLLLINLETNGKDVYIKSGFDALRDSLFGDKAEKPKHECDIANPCDCGEKPDHIKADCGNSGF